MPGSKVDPEAQHNSSMGPAKKKKKKKVVKKYVLQPAEGADLENIDH